MEIGQLKITRFKWEVNVLSFEGLTVGQYLLSPKFSSESFRDSSPLWQLKLYPQGNYEDDKSYLSVYLANLSGCQTIATFSLSIFNQDNIRLDKNKAGHNYSVEISGFRKFISKSIIMDPKNNVLKDNKLSIVCKIIIQENRIEKKEVDCTEYSCRFKENFKFEKFLSNNEFSDFTVTAEGKIFYLHRIILASESSVFEAMFKNNMKEKNEGTVNIPDIKYNVLQELFQFMYTGKVSDAKVVTSEVLTAAEKYCVGGLKALCEEEMSNCLKKDNAIQYLKSAIQNNCI